MLDDQQTRAERIFAEQERLEQLAFEESGDDQKSRSLVRRVLARLVSDTTLEATPGTLDSAVSAALCAADSRRAAPVRDVSRPRVAPTRSARERIASPVRRPE